MNIKKEIEELEKQIEEIKKKIKSNGEEITNLDINAEEKYKSLIADAGKLEQEKQEISDNLENLRKLTLDIIFSDSDKTKQIFDIIIQEKEKQIKEKEKEKKKIDIDSFIKTLDSYRRTCYSIKPEDENNETVINRYLNMIARNPELLTKIEERLSSMGDLLDIFKCTNGKKVFHTDLYSPTKKILDKLKEGKYQYQSEDHLSFEIIITIDRILAMQELNLNEKSTLEKIIDRENELMLPNGEIITITVLNEIFAGLAKAAKDQSEISLDLNRYFLCNSSSSKEQGEWYRFGKLKEEFITIISELKVPDIFFVLEMLGIKVRSGCLPEYLSEKAKDYANKCTEYYKLDDEIKQLTEEKQLYENPEYRRSSSLGIESKSVETTNLPKELVKKLEEYSKKSITNNYKLVAIISNLTDLKKIENLTGEIVYKENLHGLPRRLKGDWRSDDYLTKNVNLDEQYDSELTELAQEAGKTKDDLETEIATCDHEFSEMTRKCKDILYELFKKVTGKGYEEYSSSLEFNRREKLYRFINSFFHSIQYKSTPKEKIENLEGLISKMLGLDSVNENEETLKSKQEELKGIKSGKDDRLYDKGNGKKAKIKFLFRLSKKYRKNRETLINDCNEQIERIEEELKLYEALMAQAEQDQIFEKISHLIKYFTFKEKYQIAILVKKSIEYYEQEIHKKREELPKFTKEEIAQLRAYVHAHYGACPLYDELSEINDQMFDLSSIIELATKQQISYQERYGEDITEKIVNSGSIETGYTPEEELEEINKRRK